jgi:hypothetical protein
MWGRRETAGQSWWSLITLGEQMKERNRILCAEVLCHAKESSPHCLPVLLSRSAPIRVREKRMNTYMTAKTQESYQKVSK